jgi:hypothetical protein
VQLRGGFTEPSRVGNRWDISGPVLDFLTDMGDYPRSFQKRLEEDTLNSQVAAWRSRWMPVSNNGSIKMQAPEPKPTGVEISTPEPKPKLFSPPERNGSNGVKTYPGSLLKRLIQKALLDIEKDVGNQELLVQVARTCTDEDLKKKLRSNNHKTKLSIRSTISQVRKDGKASP